ncbi:MAG: 3-phosphoserine/phosphohydroxythreonine transaminase [Bacteroidales bacterium]|nr:3-phosphoserine/phosphohydroxythreonine transaminase [Bacteroidales bacterium]
MRKHIFNAGPCKLSDSLLKNTSEAIVEFNGLGQSLIEISHRSKDFQAVMDESVELMKEVLSIPDGYSVVFLGGGASLQFCMIPYNFMASKAFYLNTGTWASKAIKEAKMWGEVVEVSSKDKNFSYYPKGYDIPNDVDYVHITTNNTISGTEIFEDLDVKAPLIADMSSDFLSRPVDVAKYDMIYGGAQKNLGPAGVTFIIIKDELLNKVVADRPIPTMLQYGIHIDKGSMYNTPPVFNIFAVRETLKWVKAMGGVEAMEKLAIERAELLYNTIDSSNMFVSPIAKEDRSRMNIVFVMKDQYKDKEAEFVAFAGERNCIGIKGHRSVGGFRASTYNASTIEDVQALVKAMNDFEAKNA